MATPSGIFFSYDLLGLVTYTVAMPLRQSTRHMKVCGIAVFDVLVFIRCASYVYEPILMAIVLLLFSHNFAVKVNQWKEKILAFVRRSYSVNIQRCWSRCKQEHSQIDVKASVNGCVLCPAERERKERQMQVYNIPKYSCREFPQSSRDPGKCPVPVLTGQGSLGNTHTLHE